jgi:hypothetical protein
LVVEGDLVRAIGHEACAVVVARDLLARDGGSAREGRVDRTEAVTLVEPACLVEVAVDERGHLPRLELEWVSLLVNPLSKWEFDVALLKSRERVA